MSELIKNWPEGVGPEESWLTLSLFSLLFICSYLFALIFSGFLKIWNNTRINNFLIIASAFKSAKAFFQKAQVFFKAVPLSEWFFRRHRLPPCRKQVESKRFCRDVFPLKNLNFALLLFRVKPYVIVVLTFLSAILKASGARHVLPLLKQAQHLTNGWI